MYTKEERDQRKKERCERKRRKKEYLKKIGKKPWKKWFYLSPVIISLCIAFVGAWYYERLPIISFHHPLKVLAIGGSVAWGFNDKPDGGYLLIAMQNLNAEMHSDYVLYNKSIVGDGPLRYGNRFYKEMNEIHPNILIISWGMLDDISNKTPITAFESKVHQEISYALWHHVAVFVVTPPETNATYEEYPVQEKQFCQAEMDVASSFHNPNVYEFHLLSDMENYIAKNHLNYQNFAGNGWHPNAAGHELAGTLLTEEIASVIPSYEAETATMNTNNQHR